MRCAQAGFDAYLVRPVRRSRCSASSADVSAPATANAASASIPAMRGRDAAGVAAPRAASLDVLLAEDNEINALLARAVLEGLGHTVTEVRDGAAALAAVARPAARLRRDPDGPAHAGPRRPRGGARHPRPEQTRAACRARRFWRSPPTCCPKRAPRRSTAGIDAVLEKPMTPDALRRALAELVA